MAESYLAMLHDDPYSDLEDNYYGSQVYLLAASPGPSNVQSLCKPTKYAFVCKPPESAEFKYSDSVHFLVIDTCG